MASATDEAGWVDVDRAVTSSNSSSGTLEQETASERSTKRCIDPPDGDLDLDRNQSEDFPAPPAFLPLSRSESGSIEVALNITNEMSASSTPAPEPVHSQLEPAAVPPNAATVEDVDGEWTQTECHMNDIRYAQKEEPDVPERKACLQLKLLVTGQPETGRTTTIRNLFASIVKDAAWCPKDVSSLTMEDFKRDPEAFSTVLPRVQDVSGHYDIDYIVQETPGLRGDAESCAAMLADAIAAQQAQYAAAEQNVALKRDALPDGRVDAVLYFLPINARMAESELDLSVISRLAKLVPVIPVMSKADCLEEEEVQRRKMEMSKLIESGLPVYQFPEDAVKASMGEHVCLSPGTAVAPDFEIQPGPKVAMPIRKFQLPFNVVVGAHTDDTVHKYWFVRKYKWAMCEAYRTANSDLKLLRQLLLEQGFWALKGEADRLFRAHPVTHAAQRVRYAGRGSRMVSEHVEGLHEAAKGTQNVPVDPFTASNTMGHVLNACSTPSADTVPSLFAACSGNEPSGSQPIDPFIAATAPLVLTSPIISSDAATEPHLPAEPEWKPEDYKEVVVDAVQRSGSERKSFRMTLKVEGEDKVLCMRIGDAEGSALVSMMRDTSVARCVGEMAKTLAVMRALEVPQHVAEVLLQAHRGCVSEVVSAVLDGHHG